MDSENAVEWKHHIPLSEYFATYNESESEKYGVLGRLTAFSES